MDFVRYIKRLEGLDLQIKLEHTGEPERLAQQLGVSRSMLYICLRQMKLMGAKICYCKTRKTFYYKEKLILICGYLKATKITRRASYHKINFEVENSQEILRSSNYTGRNSMNGQTSIPFFMQEDGLFDMRRNPLP